LTKYTDANGNSTAFTYDAMNRVTTKTDPLLGVETYQYDVASQLAQVVDRKGQLTNLTYDALNRRTTIVFGATANHPTSFDSTITYSFDAGDRMLQIADSQNGTIVRTYDLLDRLTQEQTVQGTISYTYDVAGRRQTRTVSGGTSVAYTFDAANRLLQLQQGTQNVSFAYDSSNQRTQTTLPNGVAINYTFDGAGQVTAISYAKGASALGNLTFTYDLDGRRSGLGGSFARTNIPLPVASTTYNRGSQLTQWASQALAYDADGNLISDGLYTYVWNSRNQLVSVT
jgi:YD repeat-containing protein